MYYDCYVCVGWEWRWSTVLPFFFPLLAVAWWSSFSPSLYIVHADKMRPCQAGGMFEMR
jgi:hypothetical protein